MVFNKMVFNKMEINKMEINKIEINRRPDRGLKLLEETGPLPSMESGDGIR
jgi:hypothetical protein